MKHYRFVKNRFSSKLMCLSKPVEVTDSSNKTLAYYGIRSPTVQCNMICFIEQE